MYAIILLQVKFILTVIGERQEIAKNKNKVILKSVIMEEL